MRHERSQRVTSIARAGNGQAPRPLLPAELEAVDDALTPWARARALAIRQKGVIASSTRSTVVATVEGEIPYEAPKVPASELRRRIAALQVPLPWARPVRRSRFDGMPAPGPRIVVLREIKAHYELITVLNPWHAGRSRSLLAGLAAKHRACGRRELACACRRCGQLHKVVSRCDDRFCIGCSSTFYGRLRAKLIHAAHAHQRALWTRERHLRLRVDTCEHCGRQHPRHAEGRSRPQLWTLTVEHGASAEETRARITKAWVRLRAWLWKELGRALPYALVWEWTRGTGEHGAHVHAHVLVLAPPLCWQRLSAEWVRATEGLGRGIGHPRPGKLGGPAVSSTAAARYIAKYASKGSAIHEGEECDPELLAEVWASGYARRRVTASRGFWVRSTRITPCCLAPWVVLALWGALLGKYPQVPPVTGPPS